MLPLHPRHSNLPPRLQPINIAAQLPAKGAATMESEAPVKVIYIAGYGRSGSTLLDIALGQYPSIFGAGEVTTLARHVWDGNEYCACRSTVHDCQLWKRVVERWRTAGDSKFITQYCVAQERMEGILSWRRLIGAAWAGASQAHFRDQTTRLFRVLRAVSGRPIIVDSSKLPGRAFALAALPSIELYVVHLVRDGRGVAWSMMKPFRQQLEKGLQKELKPKPLIYTALRWAIVNVTAQLLCWKVGPRRSMRVRYEDFVEDPAKILERVLAMVGQKGSEVASLDARMIFPQHQVAGSRHRMQEVLTIERDDGWEHEMPRSKQLAFSLVCAPLMLWYGYMLSPSKRSDLREALAS